MITQRDIALEDPGSADARWCLAHYFAELDARFEQRFDPTRVLPVEQMHLSPPSGAFLLARVDGRPAGCGVLRTLSPGVGEIARMWVDSAHRGLGIGRRILEALEEQAVALGFDRVRLDTNKALDEAKAMYRGSGYVEIARYNENPYADHWFEKRLSSG
jgi:GNAT superfamily N-acetyltransferase